MLKAISILALATHLETRYTQIFCDQKVHKKEKERRETLKMIFLIYGGTKPIIDVNDWLYQTKIHIVYIFYKIYQGIPPYFMALSSMNKV